MRRRGGRGLLGLGINRIPGNNGSSTVRGRLCCRLEGNMSVRSWLETNTVPDHPESVGHESDSARGHETRSVIFENHRLHSLAHPCQLHVLERSEHHSVSVGRPSPRQLRPDFVPPFPFWQSPCAPSSMVSYLPCLFFQRYRVSGSICQRRSRFRSGGTKMMREARRGSFSVGLVVACTADENHWTKKIAVSSPIRRTATGFAPRPEIIDEVVVTNRAGMVQVVYRCITLRDSKISHV
jgi:hypothetical protein